MGRKPPQQLSALTPGSHLPAEEEQEQSWATEDLSLQQNCALQSSPPRHLVYWVEGILVTSLSVARLCVPQFPLSAVMGAVDHSWSSSPGSWMCDLS